MSTTYEQEESNMNLKWNCNGMKFNKQ